jgi:uncharacterized protein YceK
MKRIWNILLAGVLLAVVSGCCTTSTSTSAQRQSAQPHGPMVSMASMDAGWTMRLASDRP